MDDAIEDLHVETSLGDDLVLSGVVAEVYLQVGRSPKEHAYTYLQPDEVTRLRDWCTEWLALHATLQIGGPG